ncbi:hypothetical protein EV126DRAFT_405906 [Verticillium dahliae]|nr:hypothetical protein EV126DRAFT_405906 [Verticillium dahliae]
MADHAMLSPRLLFLSWWGSIGSNPWRKKTERQTRHFKKGSCVTQTQEWARGWAPRRRNHPLTRGAQETGSGIVAAAIARVGKGREGEGKGRKPKICRCGDAFRGGEGRGIFVDSRVPVSCLSSVLLLEQRAGATRVNKRRQLDPRTSCIMS